MKSTDHSAEVTVTCEHGDVEIESTFVRSPDRKYVKRALGAMKKLAREQYSKRKVKIEASFS